MSGAPNETSRLLSGALLGVVCLAAGWFGRGKWDGLDISTSDSADQSQEFVTAGAEATSTINEAQAGAVQANERVRESIKVQYVDRACPEGTGAVSGSLTDELHAAFSEGSATR